MLKKVLNHYHIFENYIRYKDLMAVTSYSHSLSTVIVTDGLTPFCSQLEGVSQCYDSYLYSQFCYQNKYHARYHIMEKLRSLGNQLKQRPQPTPTPTPSDSLYSNIIRAYYHSEHKISNSF